MWIYKKKTGKILCSFRLSHIYTINSGEKIREIKSYLEFIRLKSWVFSHEFAPTLSDNGILPQVWHRYHAPISMPLLLCSPLPCTPLLCPLLPCPLLPHLLHLKVESTSFTQSLLLPGWFYYFSTLLSIKIDMVVGELTHVVRTWKPWTPAPVAYSLATAGYGCGNPWALLRPQHSLPPSLWSSAAREHRWTNHQAHMVGPDSSLPWAASPPVVMGCNGKISYSTL